MAKINKDIQSKTPEFAVTVTHKNILYSPKYILLDGEPVYLCDLNNNAYSFPANSGMHTISFRYFNKLYTLKIYHSMPEKNIGSVSISIALRNQMLLSPLLIR
ncbi:hypothetical protein EMGBS15_05150 [Filimonas sp.]|nr:hypothetical protein EMGBS15_05150 [Filimonas sp.]